MALPPRRRSTSTRRGRTSFARLNFANQQGGGTSTSATIPSTLPPQDGPDTQGGGASTGPTVRPGAPVAGPNTQAPPRTSAPAPLPVDPAYDAQVGGYDKQRDRILAGLPGQRTEALSEYGYSAAMGPNGKINYNTLAFDPSNPYSRAALLKRTYDQSRAGSTNSMAARGQLYSGALQNQQNDLTFRQGADEDSLFKSLVKFLTGVDSQEALAIENHGIGVGQAMGERIARAPSNPLYEPTPAAAAPPPPSPSVAPPAPSNTAPGASTNTSQSGVAGGSADTTIIVRPSASHGGRLWRYRRGASGKLIPLGPA